MLRQSDFVRVDEVHKGEKQNEVILHKFIINIIITIIKIIAKTVNIKSIASLQVKEVTYFVSDEFNKATYDSCKNVQYPETSDTVSFFNIQHIRQNCHSPP